MSTQHSYRVHFKTNLTSIEDFISKIPHDRLLKPRLVDEEDYFLTTHISNSHSFGNLIPKNKEKTIEIVDGELIFCADMLSPQRTYRPDIDCLEVADVLVGFPSNEAILLKVLGESCSEQNGTIVGAMLHEHSDRWTMLVYLDGEFIKYYYQSGYLHKPEPPMLELDRMLVFSKESLQYTPSVDGIPVEKAS